MLCRQELSVAKKEILCCIERNECCIHRNLVLYIQEFDLVYTGIECFIERN